jgi:hypothetical protein
MRAASARRYAPAMTRLLACPFCRQLYGDAEGVESCPECGLPLRPFERLPPSFEVEPQEYVAPEDRRLPFGYVRRGRGALLVLAIAGFATFFCPWLRTSQPDTSVYTGFDLARGNAGWLWAGAVAWFVLLPLVASRRTITQMRGVRIICTLFAAMTLVDILLLFALRASSGRVPVSFTWSWGLYVSLALSALGAIIATRFGGRLDDLPAVTWTDSAGDRQVESSAGETLH